MKTHFPRHLSALCLCLVLTPWVSGPVLAQQKLSPLERAAKQLHRERQERAVEKGTAEALQKASKALERAERAAADAEKWRRAAEAAAKSARDATEKAKSAAEEARRAVGALKAASGNAGPAASSRPAPGASSAAKPAPQPAATPRSWTSPGGSAENQLRIIADATRNLRMKVILKRDFDTLPPNCYRCNEGAFLLGNNTKKNGPLPDIDSGRLRFTVRSNTGAAAGGNYFVKFPKDEAGPGESLYVRWQQRFDSAFIEASKAGGGFKIAIIGDANQNSCSTNDIVFVNGYNRGPIQGYHACGRFEGIMVHRRGIIDLQPGGDNKCIYTRTGYRESPGGCYMFVPDETFTFEVRIDVASAPNEKSRIRLWVTRESRGRELVMDYHRVLVDAAKGYGAVWLLPYNTGKKPSVAHPEAHTWYDNLLIAKIVK